MSNKLLLEFVQKSFEVGRNAVYAATAFASLLWEAARFSTYVETAGRAGLPNADTLHYHVEKVAIGRLHNAFLAATAPMRKRLKGKQVTVILDLTPEPFYGKSKTAYIHGYHPASGSRGSFAFLVCFALCGEERLVLDAVPVRVGAVLAADVARMLDRVKQSGIRVKVVLLDRGLANHSDILCWLEQRGMWYLGLYPKYANVKPLVKAMESDTLWAPFVVGGVQTTLVAMKDGTYVWTWVTNLRYGRFGWYRRLYRRRWNIETGFRVQDEARIKTKSIDIVVRTFVFLAALLLYNVWKTLPLHMPFKRFLIRLDGMHDLLAACGIP